MKQVIIMRTDLNMRKGKMIVQGGHAVASTFMALMMEATDPVEFWNFIEEWRETGMKKICVGIGSLAELDEIQDKALKAGLLVQRIVDAGHTEFKEPTVTCIIIGPHKEEDIDPITGHLELL
jgi:PTH2 family peptidyl-tRNA hydrolase